MWRSSNSISITFELRTFSTDSKFEECLSALLSNANSWQNSCSKTDFILSAQTARECRLTVFLKFNLSHKLQLLNVQHNFCLVMCYSVLLRTVILLTLGNNIVTLLLFNWSKPVHYVPTNKINASTCIRIRRIFKVKIRIRWMRILTSLVTSLVQRLVTIHRFESRYICWRSTHMHVQWVYTSWCSRSSFVYTFMLVCSKSFRLTKLPKKRLCYMLCFMLLRHQIPWYNTVWWAQGNVLYSIGYAWWR